MPEYVPRKGDFIALTFDPQSGHEQRGRRPALLVSDDLFNAHTGLCIVCPITRTHRPEGEACRKGPPAGLGGSVVTSRRVLELSEGGTASVMQAPGAATL
jgi:mRNA-degrading endonuclease toxin of MazEF toxin-antitoxin module